LRDAERALGTEPSEENFAWLRDVQERLSALAGSEAEIEGFGASSGRPVRTY
jgi:DNA primase